MTGCAASGGALQDHFEDKHRRRADPWRVETRWYEIRKRAVTLAALPAETYGSTLELGCSIGVLTEGLARRSDHVYAVDFAAAAVATARARLATLPHVRVMQHDVTDGLPAGSWDLVVLSELGYYLTAPQLTEVLARIESQLVEGGVLLACHWRHPEPDFVQSGDAVHRLLAFESVLDRVVHHEEADFVLDVYSNSQAPVARSAGTR